MPRCNTAGSRQIARRRDRGGVILQPREPARAVHPESAQESDLADRGADVGRQPRARGQHQQHLAGRGAQTRTTRTPPRRHTPGRRSPTPARATTPSPSRAAATGPYQRSHAARRSVTRRSPMPVTRTSFPGGAVVAMVNRCRASRLALRPALLRDPLDRGPPGRRQHGRDREHQQQDQRRVNRCQQRHGHAQPQDPAERGEDATCTCGRARTPGCAAWTAGRDTPAVPGAQRSRWTPAAAPRATRARSSPCRGSGAARAC